MSKEVTAKELRDSIEMSCCLEQAYACSPSEDYDRYEKHCNEKLAEISKKHV